MRYLKTWLSITSPSIVFTTYLPTSFYFCRFTLEWTKPSRIVHIFLCFSQHHLLRMAWTLGVIEVRHVMWWVRKSHLMLPGETSGCYARYGRRLTAWNSIFAFRPFFWCINLRKRNGKYQRDSNFRYALGTDLNLGVFPVQVSQWR